MSEEVRVPIHSDSDIISARQRGRELASRLGMSPTDLTLVATAVSELSRNIILYAGRGEIILRLTENHGRRGVIVIACDEGPGISDIAQAMREGYSTSRSLGLGLPGVKRLMDEFEIVSGPGRGTTVTVKKWKR